MLALHLAAPFHEVVITGPEAEARRRELASRYLPNVLWAGAEAESGLALLENRFVPGQTLLYVCRDRVCGLPVRTASEALAQLGA